MPANNAFTASGSTELQRYAELALYLLRYLEQRRDPHERTWRGDRGVRTLQYTCHCLEALHELGLRGLTNHLIEPAANWLLALPLDLPDDDLRGFRLYPSRFKTLALLGRFDAARLMGDFDALSQLFDPGNGWIHDAPTDLPPTLVTLIWADTLLYLEPHGLLTPETRAARDQALNAVEAAFRAWVAKAQAEAQPGEAARGGSLRPGEFPSAGDASYALHVLGRAGRLAGDSGVAEAARAVLLEALRQPRRAGARASDSLYIALHLQKVFPQHTATRETVQAGLAALRTRYENDDCQREPAAFHGQVLRLLAAHLGEPLRTAMLEKLWRDSVAAAEAQEKQEQQQLEAEFANLVRQSIRVHLAPPQRITGTRARGEVYRVRFGLTTESTDEHGAPLSTPRETLRLIVKKGPPEVLARASRRYHSLPEPVQRLFARHADMPAAQTPGYLIMQDLADMQPLSEVLAELDRPVVLGEERQKAAAEVAEAVARTMQTLHSHDRRPSVVGHQLDVAYLAPMALALEGLTQPLAFPEIRPWLTGPLVANRRKFRPLDWYLNQLRRHEAGLNPTSLGYVHGDCHSRNLMLARDLGQAKFVDIETLARAGDYIEDYGLLLEDVAVYQSLPYGNERGRIEWDDIQTERPRKAGDTAAPEPGNYIAYPAFPRSEATVAFQTALMRHLEAYAASVDDTGWKARLWLAIARGLLLLASRQLVSQDVEPHRRLRGPRYVNDVKLVQVAYAEALRLLRELVEHLSGRKGAALPDIPFPGEHRAAARAAAARGSPAEAFTIALQQALGEAAERRPVPEQPHLTDFVTRPGQHLFGRLRQNDGDTPVLYLAGRPDQLADPAGLARPLGPDDAPVAGPGLGSRVALPPDAPVADIIELARQAYQLADNAA